MVANQQALGYYVVSGKIFNSKIAACIYATQAKQTVEWVFNDQQLNSFDWTKEPELSLPALYLRRAREIREKYDYVILSYSGGSDSHNILQTFLDNGLFIDEILVNTFEQANKTIDNRVSSNNAENYGAEYKLQIYPRLEEIRHKSPATKITISDQSDFLLNTLLDHRRGADWVISQREVLNPSGISRYNYLHQKDVRVRIDKQQSVCLIFGIEKPVTYIDANNQYKLMFVDSATNIATADTHFADYDNTSVEYFYWGPTCMELIAKQSHVVKHWLEANPQYKSLWLFKDGPTFKSNTGFRHALLRTVLYDNWDTRWFQVVKGRMDWYDSLDNWFFAMYDKTKQGAMWNRGIRYVRDNAHAFVEGNGLRPFTKHFHIGSMK